MIIHFALMYVNSLAMPSPLTISTLHKEYTPFRTEHSVAVLICMHFVVFQVQCQEASLEAYQAEVVSSLDVN